MARDITTVTVQPEAPPAAKGHSNVFSAIIYVVMILLIFVCAVVINLVVDADSPASLWVMTMFGAFVISAIISGAAIHSMKEGPF